ncbi:Abrin-a, partial [Bienertia sinuspersici]
TLLQQPAGQQIKGRTYELLSMRLLCFIVVAWACWLAIVVEPQECMGLGLSTSEKGSINQLSIYKIKFSTEKATKASYMRFIKDLYNALTNNADRTGDIPILPPPLQPNNPQQYVHVELSNGRSRVTLAIDISNVYVMGVQAGEVAYFFSDVSSAIHHTIFPESTQQERLSFTSQYGSMEGAARSGRKQIPLGIGVLGNQIDGVHTGETSKIARALIVMIQMVSEAVRFRNIEQKVVATIHGESHYGEFYPDSLMIEYENSWDPLSTAVQSAVDGIFSRAVQLVYDGQVQIVETVRQILFILSIMPLKCRRNLEANQVVVPEYHSSINNKHYYFASSILSIVSPIKQEMRGYGDGDDSCNQVLDPKVHITGYNGLCVSVNNGDYHNGNSIVLSECKQGQESQLWSLRSLDQTIRSKGKCLTTYGYKPGHYIMIYDCDTAVPDATKWQINSNVGQIINPKSKLSLTAKKDDSTGVYNLVVDQYQYITRQVWYPTNNTNPPVAKIVGLDSLCLTLYGTERVQMERCDQNIKDKKWAVYPDGSIRPEQHRGRCLKYENVITLGACGGWSDERWMFKAMAPFYMWQLIW